jgi:hypothetical protein
MSAPSTIVGRAMMNLFELCTCYGGRLYGASKSDFIARFESYCATSAWDVLEWTSVPSKYLVDK